MSAPVQYVLVRADLPPAVQMVHVAHAAGEAIRVAPIPRDTIVRLLHVLDETELRTYHSKLLSKSFHAALVEETDGPYAGQAVSLGTEPSSERINALGKLFWHLKKVELLDVVGPRLREAGSVPREVAMGVQDDCG